MCFVVLQTQVQSTYVSSQDEAGSPSGKCDSWTANIVLYKDIKLTVLFLFTSVHPYFL